MGRMVGMISSLVPHFFITSSRNSTNILGIRHFLDPQQLFPQHGMFAQLFTAFAHTGNLGGPHTTNGIFETSDPFAHFFDFFMEFFGTVEDESVSSAAGG